MNARLIHHLVCTIAITVVTASGVAHAMAPLIGKTTASAAGARSLKPLLAVTGAAPGQAGYVHYFLLRLPDDSVEVQVGIELADQRIAWSFPGLGVVVSPFMEAAHFEAGGQGYDVWHLYGIRPFPDATAMKKLQRELPARVDRWVKADIPYCLDDGAARNCMSCLGFVLRALYPGRGDYPAMPRDFSRTQNPARYTPNDLLLYMTGMLGLPNRQARLQRLSRLALTADLREDLEVLVRAMGIDESIPVLSAQKRASVSRGGSSPKKL